MLNYSGDAGNFHTYRNEVTVGGTHNRLDYYGAFSRFDSSNALPMDRYHAATSAANVGYNLTANTCSASRFAMGSRHRCTKRCTTSSASRPQVSRQTRTYRERRSKTVATVGTILYATVSRASGSSSCSFIPLAN